MRPDSINFDFSPPRRPRLSTLLALAAVLASPLAVQAVSCITSSEMTPAQRDALVETARTFGGQIQAGNAASVRQATIASVATQFDPVAASIQAVAPQIQAATLTVNAIYLLKASDLKAAQDETQFFCSVPGSSLVITLTIPQLPPGDYALVLMHATGVEHPQQLSLLLQNDPLGSAQWKLAGFFVRPLAAAGHDGVWYWTAARNYAQKKQDWNAYFYYQTAISLLNPVDFLSSPNLEKLRKEAQAVRPDQLPGADPLVLKGGGQTFNITGLRTDSFPGGLDLVVNYQARDLSDPVATHSQIVELMRALLAEHPELRQGFHGLWVYANADKQSPYAIELPMNKIP
ncbi:MAG TPA: hypothetical protein VHT28_12225 [Silvibacterium sp.]|nr:hypothetical protein [Silvibacterium sp.]